MQVIFSTHSFCSRYYKNQSLKAAFDIAPADPTVDLNMQLTKLANGLLSGKYSVPAVQNDDVANAVDSSSSAKQEGIRPRMFKAVIAASHPEFSSMRQQAPQGVSSLELKRVFSALLGRGARRVSQTEGSERGRGKGNVS